MNTPQDGIIKSLETLIKHEKTIQAQEAHIHHLQDMLEKALRTITMHDHKLNLLCGVSTTLALELQAVKDKQFTFGTN
jgi:hypothetical protein